MVIADDEVDAERAGVGYLLDGLGARVYGDDELDACLSGLSDPGRGDAVALIIAVGDMVAQLVGGTVSTEIAVEQRHGRGAVDIVVAVDEDLVPTLQGEAEACHGGLHVLHEEGIVQLLETRMEEALGLLHRANAALDQEAPHRGIEPEAMGEATP